MQLHVDAQIDIEVITMVKLWDEFASGAYDVALTPRLPFMGQARIEPVYADRVVFFSAPAHRLAGLAQVAFAELRDEQLVGKFSEAYWGRVHGDLRERGCGFAQSIDLSSAEAVKRIVASGVGVGILFESTVKAEFEGGDLVRLPVSDFDYEQIYFLMRGPAETTPQAELFCGFVRDELARIRAS